jgi:hypothetical protein
MSDLRLELQTGEIEGLLFQASTMQSRGRAGKTYTIEIPKTSRNIELLGDVWAVHELNYLKFAATLRTEWADIPGTLILNDFQYHMASGQFVFGVGMIGSELDGVMLRDIDFSELDHNLADLDDGFFDGTEKYVYDMGQRGAYKESRVAIDELYPAYNCKELLRIILSDYAPDLSEVDDSVYWIFTEDYEFRNSPQWQRGAIMEVEAVHEEQKSYDHTFSYSVALDFDVTGNISKNEIKDPGGNVDASLIYTTPEAGTYQFNVLGTVNIDITPDGTPPTISYNSVNGRVRLRITIDGDSDVIYDKVLTDTGVLTLNYQDNFNFTAYLRAIAAGQPVKLNCKVDFNVTGPDAIDPNITVVVDFYLTKFSCDVSRYYGHGSTVSANDLLPDIEALDFVSLLITGMNLMMYGDAITGEIKIVNQANKGSFDTLELRDITQTINHRSAFQLVFNNDAAARLPEKITTQLADYGDVYQIDMGIARLGVGFVAIIGADNLPILILNEEEWRTKMNYRLARLDTTDGTKKIEVQKFSTTGADFYQVNVVPQWSELDYPTLFADSVTRGVRMIEGIGRFTADLLTVDRYIYAVDVRDKNTGETLGIGYIIEAEQLEGDIYRYTLMI